MWLPLFASGADIDCAWRVSWPSQKQQWRLGKECPAVVSNGPSLLAFRQPEPSGNFFKEETWRRVHLVAIGQTLGRSWPESIALNNWHCWCPDTEDFCKMCLKKYFLNHHGSSSSNQHISRQKQNKTETRRLPFPEFILPKPWSYNYIYILKQKSKTFREE